jgi:type VII secretion integral membrane protein EccD
MHGGATALGLTVAAGYAVLAMVAVRSWSAWFGGLALGTTLGAVTAAVVALSGVRTQHAGVVLAVFATAFAALAPLAAMRLSRLPWPRVPSDIAAFRADEEPTLGPDVLGPATAAQRMLTGLLAALGAAVVAGVGAMLHGDGPWPVVLAALLGAVWLLRSRSYSDAVQRIVLAGTGAAALGWLAVRLVDRHETALVSAGAGALALAGLACFVGARHAELGRRSPYWSRLMDVAEFLTVVALLPMAGLVLGVYQHVGHMRH